MLNEDKIRKQYDTEIENMKVRMDALPLEIKNLETQRDYLLKKIRVLSEFGKNGVKTKEDIKALMDVLCWGDLSYCCRPNTDNGQGKKCIWRDTVLRILKVTPETFMATKEKSVDALLSSCFQNLK